MSPEESRVSPIEQSHSLHGARRIEPFESVIAPEEKSGEMAAVHIAQLLRAIVILGEEERGVGTVGRILVKELVHRLQEALRLIHGDCALAAQIRLQVGHHQSGGDSFPRNVAANQPESLPAQVIEPEDVFVNSTILGMVINYVRSEILVRKEKYLARQSRA
jgi:hypothetical protein